LTHVVQQLGLLFALVAGKNSLVALARGIHGREVFEWAFPGSEVLAENPEPPKSLTMHHGIAQSPTCMLVRPSLTPYLSVRKSHPAEGIHWTHDAEFMGES
jgi:hypothetical protein